MNHINAISSGQGAPSTALIVLAGTGVFRAEHVIVADTGWESAMLASDGVRYSARDYFEQVTRPLAEEFGLRAHFVRAKDGDGKPLPNLQDDQCLVDNKTRIDLPMFGSKGGRLRQSCTSKWKISAIRQTLRSLGADTATTAIGFTLDEVHRVKQVSDVRWERHIWPLVTGEAKFHRASVQSMLTSLGIPYLLTTECDGCPHKDLYRWQKTDKAILDGVAKFEEDVGQGEFFLTSGRMPLLDSIATMSSHRPTTGLFDMPCGVSCDV